MPSEPPVPGTYNVLSCSILLTSRFFRLLLLLYFLRLVLCLLFLALILVLFLLSFSLLLLSGASCLAGTAIRIRLSTMLWSVSSPGSLQICTCCQCTTPTSRCSRVVSIFFLFCHAILYFSMGCVHFVLYVVLRFPCFSFFRRSAFQGRLREGFGRHLDQPG